MDDGYRYGADGSTESHRAVDPESSDTVGSIPTRPTVLQQRNSKKQGDVGLGVAIGWFTTKGYTVCVPLTDSQAYDLVVDDGHRLLRVQVKTTNYQHRGVYSVELRTKGGNRSGCGKTKKFDPHAVDAVFILVGDGSKYFIPATVVKARNNIALSRSYDTYRIL